jgi:OOP family OmpA-OmpF porin
MRQSVLISVLGAAALVSGCATKNYVHQNVQPLQMKLDQVADQTNKQGTELDQTRQDVAKNTAAISAIDEKATAADRRAGDAQNTANQANQKANQDSQEIAQLRGVIANLDDYKVVAQTSVLFGLNRASLTDSDKQELNTVVASTGTLKRYFIAVEGFTDQTGAAAYNLDLSKRRADAVVQYLAGERNIAFYQIRTVGLGSLQPVDTGKTREARAKNRRVEVKIYSADQGVAVSDNPGSGTVASR